MQKLFLPIALASLTLSACGGGSGSSGSSNENQTSPFAVDNTPQQSEPGNDVSTVTSTDTALPLADDSAEPDDSTENTQSSGVQTVSTVVPQPGPCVDTPPLNDGWGWNGASGCQLSVTQTSTQPVESQWGNRIWNCVSTVPEITAKWQLQINNDRTFFDLSRPTTDALYVGSWTDNGNAGFTTVWADDRTFNYEPLGSGFIENRGSRCHEDFFPTRPGDISNDDTPQSTLPVLGDGEWEYPIFFCRAWDNPSDVWALAFSPDGHIRDENRIIAGSYLFQSNGLQLFITNHLGEQTQWSVVDFESISISWGGCAHVAGPTFRTADLTPSNTQYCQACH